MEDVDTFITRKVLPCIGEYGRFQRLLNGLFCLINIPVAYQTFFMYFCTIRSAWKCNENSTCLINGTLPANDKRRCDLPKSSWTYVENRDFSIATQYGIDCEDEWLLDLLASIYFIGWGIGAITVGWFADKYGRRLLLVPCFIAILFLGGISPFLPHIYLLVVCRFLIGFLCNGTTPQTNILISEIVGNKQRAFACCIIFLSSSFATCFLALQSYLINNWKILSIICTAPYAVIILFFKEIPESIEWLLLRGKTDEVVALFSKIASWNNGKLPDNLTIPQSTKKEQKSNMFDIFRPCKIASQSLTQGYIWFVTCLGYYGLQLAAGELGNSQYRDFVLLVLVDVPSYFISMVVCNRFGRKKSSLIPMLLGALICISVSLTPTSDQFKVVRIIQGIIGKLLFSITFNDIYVWSIEIYPTSIRSKGMGFMTVSACLGSAAAPWMADHLWQFGYWCPFVALSIPSFIGSALGLWLPETKEFSSGDSTEDIVMSNSDVIKEYEIKTVLTQ